MQIEWLEVALARSNKPVIVFVHQRLDGAGDYYVRNAAQVRTLLENSGRVSSVFQGHYHAGDYKELNGIHYYTLASVLGEANEEVSYAVVDVFEESIQIHGFGHALSVQFKSTPPRAVT